jgi:septal ring factor EnvC (AmiA/AmiB activator)
VAVLAGVLSAPATPSELPPRERLEMGRLADVRERLERRRALQRHLQVQLDALTAEIEALRVQRESTSAVLQAEREQARVLEQRLDRLVPRLLARMAEVDQTRAQAAGVLADLVRKSHSVRLDPRIRARMSALSPLLLQRLRVLEHGVGSPHAHPERMIARHAQIERSLAELTSVQQRLQQERAQKRRLRQMATDQLRDVEVDVRLLGEEEARLVRLLLRDDAATVARAEPPADQLALPDVAGTRHTPVPTASADEGSPEAGGRGAPVADARNHGAARVLSELPGAAAAVAAAALPGAGPAVDAAELAVDAGWPTTSPPAKAHPGTRRSAIPRGWPGASEAAVVDGSSRATALDVLFSADGGLSGRNAGRGRARRSPPPLLPVPDGRHAGALAAGRGPELTILAAPGQAVAAPREGRVAFAGRFKSYGLLLILEHEAEYHTLLWGFARLDVRHGEQVEVGQIVGIMDATGDDPPVLHVERRRNGRPVDIAASSNGIQG